MPNFFKELWTKPTEEHKGHKQATPKFFKEFWTGRQKDIRDISKQRPTIFP